MKGIKINYSIDNFSELISIDDFSELAPKSKVKGVYFLYSKDKELLYIGKSASCVRLRLCNHLITATPNRYNDNLNEWTLEKRKHYFYFAYTIVEVEFVDMVERFLIQKFKPKFNLEFNYATSDHKESEATDDYIESEATDDYTEFKTTTYKALKIMRSSKDRVLGFLVIVGINTGLRIGDLLSLQYEDFENDSIVIIEKKTKKEMIIPINDNIKQAYEFLKTKSKNSEGNIFKTKLDTVYSIQYINRWLKKEFGTNKISSHSMRKIMGRQVFKNYNESEESLSHLSDLFNHSSIAITKRYLGIDGFKKEEFGDVYINL